MLSTSKAFMYCTAYKNLSVQNCARLLLGLPRLYLATSSSDTVRNISRFKNINVSKKPVQLAHTAYAEPYKSEETVPIIILHGLLGSKNNWNSIAKALMKNTNNRMVITLDARNHGDSPHTNELSYELMVTDLMKFLKDKVISKASFIGHSMGGRTCMLFALKYPHFVENLVVVDISPVGESPKMLELPKLFDIISGLQLDQSLSVKEARSRATAQLKAHKVDDKLISFLMTNLVEDDTTWRWKFNINSIKSNFNSSICIFPDRDVKSPCKVPTLFVAGGDSDYIREEEEHSIKHMFLAAEFVYIAGAGHWVHAEKPQEFLSVVSDFFNKVKK